MSTYWLGSCIFIHKRIYNSPQCTWHADRKSVHITQQWEILKMPSMVSLISRLFSRVLKSTKHIIWYFLSLHTDGMGIVWGKMRTDNLVRYITENTSNKLFRCLHSHNTCTISVIFSPAQCCWCRSGCWWHAENVLHLFIPIWTGVKKPRRLPNPTSK